MFVLVLQQDGGGCDYMIGCGIVVRNLVATNKEEATKEAATYFDPAEEDDDCYTFDRDDERCLCRAFVAEITHEFDAKSLANESKKKKAAEKANKIERQEKAELARLQAKYRIKVNDLQNGQKVRARRGRSERFQG